MRKREVSMNDWQSIQGDAVTFGPVPSRRLGRSLGINNIPPKICSYSCLYCQLGRTLTMQTERTSFHDPARILEEVRGSRGGESFRRVGRLPQFRARRRADPRPQPGARDRVGPALGIKIAVITNASLIWREEVRDELARADWVSLKMDSVREDVWRRIDRPHGQLRLSKILDGALAFSEAFAGRLVTETMLVEGVNDSTALLEELGLDLARLGPDTAYLGIPTCPPAEEAYGPRTRVESPVHGASCRVHSTRSSS